MTDPAIGTGVHGFQQYPAHHEHAYNQLWFIQPVPGADTYAIYNLRSGMVLELSGGQSYYH